MHDDPDASRALQAKCYPVIAANRKARRVPFDALCQTGVRGCDDGPDGVDDIAHLNVEPIPKALYIAGHANLLGGAACNCSRMSGMGGKRTFAT